MSTSSNPNGERPANPFMGTFTVNQKAKSGAGRRRHSADQNACDVADGDHFAWGDFDTDGDRLRFLHESGLDLSYFDRSPWFPGRSDDRNVQLYQGIYGNTAQAYGRTWGGWGESKHLEARHVLKGYDAVALANCGGLVLNTFISISWSTVGITAPEAVAEAHARYLELLRKALTKRGVIPAWVWVIENGKTWGLHSHILVHVPFEKRKWLRFQAAETIETIAGLPVVKTKESKTVDITVRRDDDWRTQWRWFRYMMKGTAPTKRHRNPEKAEGQVLLEESAGLELRSQGLVEGQRFGVSRKLNAKNLAQVREKMGLGPFAMEEGETDPAWLYTDEYLRIYEEWTRPQREAAAAAELERMKNELTSTLQI